MSQITDSYGCNDRGEGRPPLVICGEGGDRAAEFGVPDIAAIGVFTIACEIVAAGGCGSDLRFCEIATLAKRGSPIRFFYSLHNHIQRRTFGFRASFNASTP
jgi:hypothetical protein